MKGERLTDRKMTEDEFADFYGRVFEAQEMRGDEDVRVGDVVILLDENGAPIEKRFFVLEILPDGTYRLGDDGEVMPKHSYRADEIIRADLYPKIDEYA